MPENDLVVLGQNRHEEFCLSQEDPQDREQWSIRIKGATG